MAFRFVLAFDRLPISKCPLVSVTVAVVAVVVEYEREGREGSKSEQALKG